MTRAQLREAKTWEEIADQGQPLKVAMESVFDSVEEREEAFFAVCCGEPVSTYSGIVGPDLAECRKCKSKVLLLLSPHVSPLLIGESTTAMPSERMIDLLADRAWLAIEGKKPEAVE